MRQSALTTTDDIEAIPLDAPLYPESLRQINNPPKIIYARGNLDLLKHTPGVSIVGTRDATRRRK